MDFIYTTIGELMCLDNLLRIPQVSGVYVVDTPRSDFMPEISSETTGPEFFKGRSLLTRRKSFRRNLCNQIENAYI